MSSLRMPSEEDYVGFAEWELENLERSMRIISDQISDEGLDVLSAADPSALIEGGSRLQPSDRFTMADVVFGSQRMGRKDGADKSAASSENSSNAGSRVRRRLRRKSRSGEPDEPMTKPLVQTLPDGTTASFEITPSCSSHASSSVSRAPSSSALNYRQGCFRGGSNADWSSRRSSKAGSSRCSSSRGSLSPDRLSSNGRSRAASSHSTDSSANYSWNSPLPPIGRGNCSRQKMGAHSTSHYDSASRNIPVPPGGNSPEDSNREAYGSPDSCGSGSSFGDLEIANPRPTLNARPSRG